VSEKELVTEREIGREDETENEMEHGMVFEMEYRKGIRMELE